MQYCSKIQRTEGEVLEEFVLYALDQLRGEIQQTLSRDDLDEKLDNLNLYAR
jgi:hypothetical protein